MADPNAQFAIEVAAQLNGGETVAQLDALVENLTGAGKNADHFRDAIARVSEQLNGASADLSAANAALSDGNAAFNDLEKAANQAAKALERAAQRGEDDAGVLRKLNGDVIVANRALTDHTAKLRGLETAAKLADQREQGLSSTLKNLGTLNDHVNKSLTAQDKSLSKVQGALSMFGGRLGQTAASALGAGDTFENLQVAIGGMRALVLVTTAVVAALAAAFVAAGVAAVGWGVSLADSNRNMALSSEAMAMMHPELEVLSPLIKTLNRETNMGANELEKLATSLTAAGVAAEDLPGALRAAASAETALGSGGSSAFLADIKAGKVAVNELAANVQAKFGGIVERQMLGLSAQTERLKQNFAGLFGGLNIEPVLTGFSRLVALFDESTAMGQAMKFLFETAFGPIVAGADDAAVAIEAFALRAMIWAVKGYLAFRPYKEVFEGLAIGIGVAGGAFLLTLVPAAYAGATALAALVAPALIAASPFIAIAAAATLVYTALTNWSGLVDIVKGVFAGIVNIAPDVIAGLVGGLLAGGPAVMKALGGVIEGAVNSAKKFLGINSPSTLMQEDVAGNQIAGLTGGYEAGAEDVAASLGGVVAGGVEEAQKQAALSGDLAAFAPPSAAPAPAAPAAPAAPGGSASGAFAGAIMNFYANTVADAEALAAKVEEILVRKAQGVALQSGSALATEDA